MEKEHEAIVEEEHFKDIRAYWEELLSRAEEDKPDGVKRLLLQRGDFSNDKMPGEDKLWLWMQDYAANHKGYEWPFELNEKGIIVPVAPKG